MARRLREIEVNGEYASANDRSGMDHATWGTIVVVFLPRGPCDSPGCWPKSAIGWLTDATIRGRFFANPNLNQNAHWDQSSAIEIYGLPTSRLQRAGPFILQRFQRAVLQLWVDRVPGMPESGTVVRALVGDIA